jgi:hypothetical protein
MYRFRVWLYAAFQSLHLSDTGGWGFPTTDFGCFTDVESFLKEI